MFIIYANAVMCHSRGINYAIIVIFIKSSSQFRSPFSSEHPDRIKEDESNLVGARCIEKVYHRPGRRCSPLFTLYHNEQISMHKKAVEKKKKESFRSEIFCNRTEQSERLYHNINPMWQMQTNRPSSVAL